MIKQKQLSFDVFKAKNNCKHTLKDKYKYCKSRRNQQIYYNYCHESEQEKQHLELMPNKTMRKLK